MLAPLVALYLAASPATIPPAAAAEELFPVAALAQTFAEAAPPAPAAGSELVRVALGYLGTPYRRGGRDHTTGVDCASFVRLLYRPLGHELPQTAAAQLGAGREVPREEIAPGDLVFFRDTYKRGISHVGVALGDDRFIHASGRRRGVVVSSLSQQYFQRRFAGARRLLSGREPRPTER
jgi:cell wall-associated NlpC family hydrolase